MTNKKMHVSEFKRMIEEKVGYEKIQLVTISGPSAYGEYEPYHFVETKEDQRELFGPPPCLQGLDTSCFTTHS